MKQENIWSKRLLPDKNALLKFEHLTAMFVLLYHQYASEKQALYDSIIPHTYRCEYAKGGQAIHRGFYAPSALDLVVGGMNRGRLLKRLSKNSVPDYEYGWSENNQLLWCKTISDSRLDDCDSGFVEFLVYRSNEVLSFAFEGDILLFITRSIYEQGLLIRYETALIPAGDCHELNVEEFEYSENKLQSLFWSRYCPSIKLLEQNKYVFSRDKDDYLSTYTIEHAAEATKNSLQASEKPVYHVLARRK